MNINKLLIDYKYHEDYLNIKKLAISLAKAKHSKNQILDVIAKSYKFTKKLKMLQNRQELTIFGDMSNKGIIDAERQMSVALKIPVAVKGVLVPDAHLGYAIPIGGIIELNNSISPSFIGYDISCMVMLSIFDINVDDFMYDRSYFANILKRETLFGMTNRSLHRQHDVMYSDKWQSTKLLKSLKDKAQAQLGSSGGGNHFVDLMIIDDNKIGLLSHSGSRGAGHKVATHYLKEAKNYTKTIASVPSGYEWLDINSSLGDEYLQSMYLMGDYALANHQLIHDHFARSAGLTITEDCWNRHNYAWVEGSSIIHRKGATPAKLGEIGLIPGSSGTNSYIVRGKGNPNSLYSSSHGAGRNFSRTYAKKIHDPSAFDKLMLEKNILHFGLNRDETYQAYKDIDSIMSYQAELVDVIGVMKPTVVIMGGS